MTNEATKIESTTSRESHGLKMIPLTSQDSSQEAQLKLTQGDSHGPKRVLRATHGSPDRPLRVGALEIPCYVLENGLRVLSGRGMQASLALGQQHGTRLRRFLSRGDIAPFIPETVSAALVDPIRFTRPGRGGKLAVGYEATILVDICDGVLAARQAGILKDTELLVAVQCEILARSFAKVGIIALIDEATGYQEIRSRVALEEILARYLSKELLAWAKTFPDNFYKDLFRLRGWRYTPFSVARPRYVGILTNDIVYARLAPGLLDELRRLTPKAPSGHRKNRFHQWLTENVGHPRLREHLEATTALMRVSNDWSGFHRLLQRAYPKVNTNLEMDIDDGP